MQERYSESNYENAVLELFRSSLGYITLYGPDIEREYQKPLLEDAVWTALRRVNAHMPHAALAEAFSRLEMLESGSLLQKNMLFMDYVQNGIPVKFLENGMERSAIVHLLDYQDPASNEFTAVNQWTFAEHATKRLDIVLFVNGWSWS